MAELPKLTARRPVPDASAPIARTDGGAAAWGEIAGGFKEVGSTFEKILDRRIQEEDSADAIERDGLAAAKINKLLYDPEGGFFNRQGKDAVQTRKEYEDKVGKIIASAYDGANPRVAARLKGALMSRQNRALALIMEHSSKQGKAWALTAANETAKTEVNAVRLGADYKSTKARLAGVAAGMGPVAGKKWLAEQVSDLAVAHLQNTININPMKAWSELKAGVYKNDMDPKAHSATLKLAATAAGEWSGKHFYDSKASFATGGFSAAKAKGDFDGMSRILMPALVYKETGVKGGRTGLTSPKGAIGISQMLPKTLKKLLTTKRGAALGLAYDEDKLKNDREYGLAVGQAHLANLLEKYSKYKGGVVLALAAYNAGEGRLDGKHTFNILKDGKPTGKIGEAEGWIKRFGEPGDKLSITEWIEKIPFKETRDYVRTIYNETFSGIDMKSISAAMASGDPDFAKGFETGMRSAISLRSLSDRMVGAREFEMLMPILRDSGGDWSKIEPYAGTVKPETLAKLREYSRLLKTERKTSIGLWAKLTSEKILNRQAFASRDLTKVMGRLSEKDFQRFLTDQLEIKKGRPPSYANVERALEQAIGRKAAKDLFDDAERSVPFWKIVRERIDREAKMGDVDEKVVGEIVRNAAVVSLSGKVDPAGDYEKSGKLYAAVADMRSAFAEGKTFRLPLYRDGAETGHYEITPKILENYRRFYSKKHSLPPTDGMIIRAILAEADDPTPPPPLVVEALGEAGATGAEILDTEALKTRGLFSLEEIKDIAPLVRDYVLMRADIDFGRGHVLTGKEYVAAADDARKKGFDISSRADIYKAIYFWLKKNGRTAADPLPPKEMEMKKERDKWIIGPSLYGLGH